MIEAGPATLDRQSLGRIEKLLRQRGEVCDGLVESVRQQNALIEADESPDRLMAVLGQKQRLVNRLQQIERELKPLRELWHARKDEVEAGWRERIRRLAERAERVLKQVMDMEDIGRSRLMHCQRRPVGKVGRLEGKRQLARAYGSPAQGGVPVLDRRT